MHTSCRDGSRANVYYHGFLKTSTRDRDRESIRERYRDESNKSKMESVQCIKVQQLGERIPIISEGKAIILAEINYGRYKTNKGQY